MLEGKISYGVLPAGSIDHSIAFAMSGLANESVRSANDKFRYANQQKIDTFLRIWYEPENIITPRPLNAIVLAEDYLITDELRRVHHLLTTENDILAGIGISSHALQGNFVLLEGPYILPTHYGKDFGSGMFEVMVHHAKKYAEEKRITTVVSYVFPSRFIKGLFETKGFEYKGEVQVRFADEPSEVTELTLHNMVLDLSKSHQ